MRTVTCTIILDPEDGAFDPLTGGDLEDSLRNALMRGYPLLRESELGVVVVSDQYDPPGMP